MPQSSSIQPDDIPRSSKREPTAAALVTRPATVRADDVPGWLVVIGSAAIIGHLFAVIALVLAAPSGPWPVMGAGQMSFIPPQFAASVTEWLRPKYFEPIKMTHNYHFSTNNPEAPGVYLVFKLKDEEGKEIASVKLPDDNANVWVRHRQTLLARTLGNDQFIAPPPAEVVAAPGRKTPTVLLWQMDGSPQKLNLKKMDQNEVSRTEMVMGPPKSSMLLARSYARHLCRVHGATQAQLFRHSQSPIPPAVILGMTFPAGSFDEVVSNFGQITFKPGSLDDVDVVRNFGEISR